MRKKIFFGGDQETAVMELLKTIYVQQCDPEAVFIVPLEKDPGWIYPAVALSSDGRRC